VISLQFKIKHSYNILKISLHTHEVDGVTLKDFKLAEAIELIVEEEDE